MNCPAEPPWHLVPFWRKVVGLLWWMVWATDEQAAKFMFKEHWPR